MFPRRARNQFERCGYFPQSNTRRDDRSRSPGNQERKLLCSVADRRHNVANGRTWIAALSYKLGADRGFCLAIADAL